MAEQLILPTAFDGDGDPVPSARAFFFEASTSTPLETYSDVTLSTANGTSVADAYISANSSGVFAPTFAKEEAKVDVQDPDTGSSLPGYPRDNFPSVFVAKTTDGLSFTDADDELIFKIGSSTVGTLNDEAAPSSDDEIIRRGMGDDRYKVTYIIRCSDDGTKTFGESTWTSGKNSTGDYTITHSLSTSSYIAHVTTEGTSAETVSVVRNTSNLRVYTFNASGTATDTAFGVIIMIP